MNGPESANYLTHVPISALDIEQVLDARPGAYNAAVRPADAYASDEPLPFGAYVRLADFVRGIIARKPNVTLADFPLDSRNTEARDALADLLGRALALRNVRTREGHMDDRPIAVAMEAHRLRHSLLSVLRGEKAA